MGNLRLYGSTSGYVEIAPPAVGGSQVLTLPTDTVQPGMVLVASQSFSSASAVSINNCFTSTYQNYSILINFAGSTTTNVNWLGFRLRSGGVDNANSNYTYADYRLNSANTNTGPSYLGDDNKSVLGDITSTNNMAGSVDIYDPQTAAYTRAGHAFSIMRNTDGNVSFSTGGTVFTATTSFDGISFFPYTGTITGTIRVYGLRNA